MVQDKKRKEMWRHKQQYGKEQTQKTWNKTGLGCEACTDILAPSVSLDAQLSSSVHAAVHAFPHMWERSRGSMHQGGGVLPWSTGGQLQSYLPDRPASG